MKEMHAVVGYLPDAVAKAWAGKHQQEPLNVRLEQGSDDMHVSIRAATTRRGASDSCTSNRSDRSSRRWAASSSSTTRSWAA